MLTAPNQSNRVNINPITWLKKSSRTCQDFDAVLARIALIALEKVGWMEEGLEGLAA